MNFNSIVPRKKALLFLTLLICTIFIGSAQAKYGPPSNVGPPAGVGPFTITSVYASDTEGVKVDFFSTSDSVYATITFQKTGQREAVGIYIIDADTVLTNGAILTDVRQDGPIITTFSDTQPTQLAWSNPVEGEYRIVLDIIEAGYYNAGGKGPRTGPTDLISETFTVTLPELP